MFPAHWKLCERSQLMQSLPLTLAVLIVMGVAFLVALVGVPVCRCSNERQGEYMNEQQRLVMLINLHDDMPPSGLLWKAYQ